MIPAAPRSAKRRSRGLPKPLCAARDDGEFALHGTVRVLPISVVCIHNSKFTLFFARTGYQIGNVLLRQVPLLVCADLLPLANYCIAVRYLVDVIDIVRNGI